MIMTLLQFYSILINTQSDATTVNTMYVHYVCFGKGSCRLIESNTTLVKQIVLKYLIAA